MNLLVHFSKFNGQTGKHSDPIYLPWLLQSKDDHGNESEEDGEWEYIEDGPAEIIWQGNEIIVKKKKVKVPKGVKEKPPIQEVMVLFPHNKVSGVPYGCSMGYIYFYIV